MNVNQAIVQVTPDSSKQNGQELWALCLAGPKVFYSCSTISLYGQGIFFFIAWDLGITPSGIPLREGTRAQNTDVKATDLARGRTMGWTSPPQHHALWLVDLGVTALPALPSLALAQVQDYVGLHLRGGGRAWERWRGMEDDVGGGVHNRESRTLYQPSWQVNCSAETPLRETELGTHVLGFM